MLMVGGDVREDGDFRAVGVRSLVCVAAGLWRKSLATFACGAASAAVRMIMTLGLVVTVERAVTFEQRVTSRCSDAGLGQGEGPVYGQRLHYADTCRRMNHWPCLWQAGCSAAVVCFGGCEVTRSCEATSGSGGHTLARP